jgi:hypothetical protein
MNGTSHPLFFASAAASSSSVDRMTRSNARDASADSIV